MLLISSYILMSSFGLLELRKKNGNWLLFLSFVFLSILIGFRNMGGSDFFSYEQQYLLQYDAERWEFGYLKTSSFFSMLGFSFRFYILSISAFCLAILHYSIKRYSPWKIFSVVLYMSLFLIYYNAIALRQMFALTFIVYSIQYIEKKNVILFLFCVLLAFCFHKSAIIFLLAYPFCIYFKFHLVTIIPIILLSILLSFFDFYSLSSFISGGGAQDMLNERFKDYTTVEHASSITSFIKIGVVLFFIMFRYRKMLNVPYFSNLSKLYFIYICLFLAFDKWGIMMRVYSYFEISFIFIIPIVLSNIKFKNEINKVLLYLLIIFFFGIAYILNILSFDNGDLLKYELMM